MKPRIRIRHKPVFKCVGFVIKKTESAVFEFRHIPNYESGAGVRFLLPQFQHAAAVKERSQVK